MTVKRSSILLTLALGAASALALSGCSTPASNDADSASGTLTVWVDTNRAAELADIAKQFEADKGIAVTLVQKEYGDVMKEDFVTQVPTGKGPDVIVGGNDWLGQFVQNGVVAPLEMGDRQGDFLDVAIQAMSYEGVGYGLPVSIENLALVRNNALATETPGTWDEVIAAGQALVAAGTATYPVLIPSGADSDPYHLYPLQSSYGAPLFGLNADGSYNPDDLLIGSEGGNAFAAKLVEWGASGVLNTNIDGDIARDEFVAGTSPFMITGPWNLPAFAEGGLDYEVGPIPQAGPDESTPFVGVQGFFVSSKSTNALAANEFVVNYLGSEDVQLALFEAGGRPPALTSAFDIAAAEDDIRAFGEYGAQGVPMPNIPAMNAVWDYLGATQAALVNGTAGDPTTAWQNMTAQIQAGIDG